MNLFCNLMGREKLNSGSLYIRVAQVQRMVQTRTKRHSATYQLRQESNTSREISGHSVSAGGSTYTKYLRCHVTVIPYLRMYCFINWRLVISSLANNKSAFGPCLSTMS